VISDVDKLVNQIEKRSGEICRFVRRANREVSSQEIADEFKLPKKIARKYLDALVKDRELQRVRRDIGIVFKG